ncbi:hypothetical protein [Nitrosopumilus sp.]|uniref:hypothetical protein n=1 Tax=Nitrosopumilus sp. TaxID=2024843 RepID=UPI003B635E22
MFGFHLLKELEFWSANSGPVFIGNKDGNIKIALFKGNKENDSSIGRITFRTSGKEFISFLNRLETVPVFSLGQKIDKHNVVDHDISFSIYFNDPDGNKLELTSYDHEYLHSKFGQ